MISKRYSAAIAGALGNTLEWFDFAVYGYFATSLGKVFFVDSDPVLQSVASFGVFAIGYLARPIGSLILGPIGDLWGRKKMMTLSIVIMGLASFLIALLPVYAQVGAIAAYMLMFLRLVQGFSVGGEYTGSMVYAAEASPANKAGLMSGIAHAGAVFGFFLGSLFAAVMAYFFSQDAIESWAWRIPFFLGAVVAILGWYLRLHMPETLEIVIEHRVSLKEVRQVIFDRLCSITKNWRVLLKIAALVSFSNVLFYVHFVYFVDYVAKQTNSMQDTNIVATIVQLFGVPFIVLGGWLGDRIGRVLVTRYATWGGAVLVIPCVLLSQGGGLVGLALAQVAIVIPIMLLFGAQGVLISGLVKPSERCSLFAIGYSLSVGLFAGTAPLIVSWFLEVKSWVWAPAIYCFIYALPAIYILHKMRDESINVQ